MSHQHFTIEKRYKLQTRLDDGKRYTAIDRELGFTRGTCRREVIRNHMTDEEYTTCRIPGRSGLIARPKNSKHYSAELAQYKAGVRRYNANQSHHKLPDDNSQLAKYIIKKIKKHWSPEQISGRLRTVGATFDGVCRKIVIAVQTIYDFIYERHQELRRYLRHNRGYSHNRQYYINKRKRAELQAEKGIANRPESVELRKRIGHWEGDTVLGSSNGSTGRIATFAERKCGFLKAKKINRLTPEEQKLDESEKEVRRLTLSLRFADCCVDAFKDVKTKYCQTLTLDNGSENTAYEWIERGIPGLEIYFANPYHSWERGTNENTNGLLRQYFPKGMDFTNVTQKDVDEAVEEINNRPRKRLNWRTPKEVMLRNHACCNWK